MRFDGEDVFLIAELHGVGNVHAVRGDSIFIQADRFAIQENVARLTHALEFDKYFLARKVGRELEVFAVPRETLVGADVAAAVHNDLAEGIDVVERVRRADCGPLRIVECGNFGPGNVVAEKFPVEIEVECGARRFGRRITAALHRREHWMGPPENRGQSHCRNRRGAHKFAPRHLVRRHRVTSLRKFSRLPFYRSIRSVILSSASRSSG